MPMRYAPLGTPLGRNWYALKLTTPTPMTTAVSGARFLLIRAAFPELNNG